MRTLATGVILTRELADLCAQYAALLCVQRHQPTLLRESDFDYAAYALYISAPFRLVARLLALPQPRTSAPSVKLPTKASATDEQLVAATLHIALYAVQRYAPTSLRPGDWIIAGSHVYTTYNFTRPATLPLLSTFTGADLQRFSFDGADTGSGTPVPPPGTLRPGQLPDPTAVSIEQVAACLTYLILLCSERTQPGSTLASGFDAAAKDVYIAFNWKLPPTLGV